MTTSAQKTEPNKQLNEVLEKAEVEFDLSPEEQAKWAIEQEIVKKEVAEILTQLEDCELSPEEQAMWDARFAKVDEEIAEGLKMAKEDKAEQKLSKELDKKIEADFKKFGKKFTKKETSTWTICPDGHIDKTGGPTCPDCGEETQQYLAN
jgi:hypothetical protein